MKTLQKSESFTTIKTLKDKIISRKHVSTSDAFESKKVPFTFSESSKVAHPSIVLGNNVFTVDLSTFV